MRKRVVIVFGAVIALLAAPAALAMPVDGVTGPTYAAKAFCPAGTQVVYVTQDLQNVADRGLAGNAWATANYSQRIISVVQITPVTFCAATYYIGKFVTNGGGPSPGATERKLHAGISGIIAGGYRTSTFVGTFRPLAPTSGSIGTWNYACDSNGNCPGESDWTSLYFSSTFGYTANWWSWAYSTTSNGLWVQRADMTYGDIRN